jgi:hypothetical protein
VKTDKFLFQINFRYHIPILCQQKGLDGWGERMAILADIQY